MTIERDALNQLLDAYPMFDVLNINWQRANEHAVGPGPWLLVDLGERSVDGNEAWAVWKFAIFKRTGAVHRLDPIEGVEDPPIIAGDRVASQSNTGVTTEGGN